MFVFSFHPLHYELISISISISISIYIYMYEGGNHETGYVSENVGLKWAALWTLHLLTKAEAKAENGSKEMWRALGFQKSFQRVC